MSTLTKRSGVVSFCLLILLFIGSFTPLFGQKYSNLVTHKTLVKLAGISGIQKTIFEKNTQLLLDGINSAYLSKKAPNIALSVVSQEVNERLGNLYASSPFASVNPNIDENIIQIGSSSRYELRNIQLIFDEASKDYEQQDAVIVFGSDGKILDFRIALSAYQRITSMNGNDVTDLRRRQLIVEFIENFRTAYTLKDLNYLNMLYSDNALIITGKVIKKYVDGEWKAISTFKKQTKHEYITNLNQIFKVSKIIDVKFDSISVVQHPSFPNLYGVNLTQDWNSEKIAGGKYHDNGYIFLVIDFKIEDKPIIWVRTWQDKKDITKKNNQFNFNDFYISSN